MWTGVASSTELESPSGIDLSDRSDFYIPWTINKQNPNQLFLGTYRAYRTGNAKSGGERELEGDQRRPDGRVRRNRAERRSRL